MKAKTVEDLLQDQLAVCVAATQDCLAQSRLPREDDEDGDLRRNDVRYVARLMKASARLTEALAKLRGDTSHRIQVSHVGQKDHPGDKGQG